MCTPTTSESCVRVTAWMRTFDVSRWVLLGFSAELNLYFVVHRASLGKDGSAREIVCVQACKMVDCVHRIVFYCNPNCNISWRRFYNAHPLDQNEVSELCKVLKVPDSLNQWSLEHLSLVSIKGLAQIIHSASMCSSVRSLPDGS